MTWESRVRRGLGDTSQRVGWWPGGLWAEEMVKCSAPQWECWRDPAVPVGLRSPARGAIQGTGTRGVSQCQGSLCHRRGLRGPVREDPEGAQTRGV